MASPTVNLEVKLESTPVNKEEPFSQAWRNSDIVLVVEDKLIHVHSQILGIESAVFMRMLSSGFRESKTRRVEMVGKQYKDVLNIVKTLYPGFTVAIGLQSSSFKSCCVCIFIWNTCLFYCMKYFFLHSVVCFTYFIMVKICLLYTSPSPRDS